MPPPAPAARTRYLDVETLRALIREYRRSKVVPEPLARALLAIAGGVWDRYQFTTDRDEFTQEVVLHLLQRPIEKVHVQKHVFNYFTTCAIRYGMKLRDKASDDRRRFETYAAECVEAGRPVVDGVVGRRGVGDHSSALDAAVAAEERAADESEAEAFFAWLESFRDEVERQLGLAAAYARGEFPTRPAPRTRRRRRAK
jgi:hypothetical protein